LFHEARLQNYMSYANPQYRQQSQSLAQFFGGGPGGANMAHATIYNQLNQQASAMGYVDIYRMLCWMSCIMVCFAFLLSKNRPGEGAPAGEAVH
jgi:DHA2 family multidrug resistance protein